MKNKSYLSTAFQSLPHGVIAIDADEVIQEINSEAGIINGVDAELFTGKPAVQLAEQSELDWGDLYDAIQEQRSYDDIINSPRGKRILTTVRRLRSNDKMGSGLLILMYDLEVLNHIRRSATKARGTSSFQNFSIEKVRPDFAQQRIISEDIDKMISRGERAILQGARILITGESGVGKTELARYLHAFVADPTDPFVVVNCASIPESLFESELFGYERGAFTGALQSGKTGFIEKANGGTLFLDEIAEIPLTSQGKLLHFLEEGFVQKVGSSTPKKVSVRVIAATNQNLPDMVAKRTFRKDLFYRLAVIQLPLKPLKESIELIDHLIGQFVQKVNQRRPKPFALPESCKALLRKYNFPGNIRELYNIIQQASILADEPGDIEVMIKELLTSSASTEKKEAIDINLLANGSLKEQVRNYERKIIEATIAKLGSKRKAADHLGVDIGTVVRKTKRNNEQP